VQKTQEGIRNSSENPGRRRSPAKKSDRRKRYGEFYLIENPVKIPGKKIMKKLLW
jgi:hypothetical protein